MSDIFEHKGMQREAVAELIKALNLAGKPTLAALLEREYFSLGYAQAKGRLSTAPRRDQRVPPERTKAESHKPPMALQIANDYALLGDKTGTFLLAPRGNLSRS